MGSWELGAAGSREWGVGQASGSCRGQAACGQTHAIDIELELARHAEPFVDLIGSVEVGVVDETLPPVCGVFELKVELHHDDQLPRVPSRSRDEASGVLHRGALVMGRARTHQYDKLVTRTLQHRGDVASRLQDELLDRQRRGDLLYHARGR